MIDRPGTAPTGGPGNLPERTMNLRKLLSRSTSLHPGATAPDGRLRARLDLATGHGRTDFYGDGRASPHSVVVIAGSRSTRVEPLDLARHVPTVVVAIDRDTPGDPTDDGSGLRSHLRIELTVEECGALIAQLEGPLKPLLDRRPWTEDRT